MTKKAVESEESQVEVKSSSSRRPRADLYAERCPSREVFDHITSTWGSLILVLLIEKTYRFSELRKTIGGISEKMLAQTLQTLEGDGFVIRKVYPVMPPKVEYSLSPMGQEVAARVEALTGWVESNFHKVTAYKKSRLNPGDQ